MLIDRAPAAMTTLVTGVLLQRNVMAIVIWSETMENRIRFDLLTRRWIINLTGTTAGIALLMQIEADTNLAG